MASVGLFLLALLAWAACGGVIAALDELVVAPPFERSYAMFRTALGAWIPLAAIFAASRAAGLVA